MRDARRGHARQRLLEPHAPAAAAAAAAGLGVTDAVREYK